MRETACTGKFPFIKTIRSCETCSLSQEQCREDPPPKFNHLPVGSSHNTWELWELQFKIRFGWGHSQTISPPKQIRPVLWSEGFPYKLLHPHSFVFHRQYPLSVCCVSNSVLVPASGRPQLIQMVIGTI